MAKHRAIVVGAGRIGAGFPDPAIWSKRYLYSHAEAYVALKDRIELFAFVDPDPERRAIAVSNFPGVHAVDSLEAALEVVKPSIVSVCTPPAERDAILKACADARVQGVWCEKPYGSKRTDWPFKVQVNYIRRFDEKHRMLKGVRGKLLVRGKRDVHTVCHFADLARLWRIHPESFTYEEVNGPCSYHLTTPHGCCEFAFPDGGIPDGSPFMTNALTNLLDAVEGTAALASPPESAIESEKWAQEILEA